jgi:hypothetical protein
VSCVREHVNTHAKNVRTAKKRKKRTGNDFSVSPVTRARKTEKGRKKEVKSQAATTTRNFFVG